MGLISRIKLNISDRLQKDNGFRERFFLGQAQDEIATSIRTLREEREMKQVDLAKATGMKQSAISRIEQAEYSGWSFKILFRVANALDARLKISFEPSENVVAYYREKEQGTLAESKAGLIVFCDSSAVRPELHLTEVGATDYTYGENIGTAQSSFRG